MPWALMGGTAVLGAIQAAQQRERDNKFNQAQAEVTRYSPWTGISGQQKQSNANMLSGAMGGGMTGAMMAQQFGKSGNQYGKASDYGTNQYDLARDSGGGM